jgi:alpha-L-arabinofuranosidase
MRLRGVFLLLSCAACAAAQVMMPDGSPFESWADQTRYTKTYHVNRSDPRSSDENPGTEAQPFRTINRAAKAVKPGERIWIHAGVYRELVRPRVGGEAPDKMIAYEAAPGEQVIIKGSRVVESRWERSVDPHNTEGRSIYSKRLWMTALADSMFENGYFAFREQNASNVDLDLMSWALRWKGRIPYSLPRGMLFEEGRRMVQLGTYEDLVRLPGSYWVAPDGKTVHVHPFGAGDPNGRLFEAAVQPHIIQPEAPGLGYIRISGLILEQCANGLPRVGIGALYTMGGHHWIIERNTVRHVNSVGIEMGYLTFERGDKRFPPRTDPDLGHHIVRGNRIYDCGTAGIRGLNVSHALVEDNDITECGWQDAEFHWEVAGIKLLVNRGTLVQHNRISRQIGGCGIWLDWDNQNSRVTGNVIHDIQTVQGAIFIEASPQPNLVDNNIIWNIDGQGIRAADTDNLVIAHNLFGHIKDDLVVARVATDRSIRGRKLTSTGNRFVNNIVFDAARPIASGDPSNTADYNVYVSSQAKDTGEHSVSIAADIQFDAAAMLVTWKPSQAIPRAPLVKGCPLDLAGRDRTVELNVPGPWLGATSEAAFRLTER